MEGVRHQLDVGGAYGEIVALKGKYGEAPEPSPFVSCCLIFDLVLDSGCAELRVQDV